ncbi:hypothetical protein ACFWCF_12860 [Rhodococcus sp. NPDC060090]
MTFPRFDDKGVPNEVDPINKAENCSISDGRRRRCRLLELSG